MAHSKSARKRIRQNAGSRLRNRSTRSALRTTVKKFRSAVKAGDATAASQALKAVQERVDKTASKGITHRRTAARIKSRMAAKLSRLRATQTSKPEGPE